jgi:hypothetical protein
MTGGRVAAPGYICPNTTGSGQVGFFTLMYWITCEAGGSAAAVTEFPGTGGVGGVPLLSGVPIAEDSSVDVVFLPAGASIGLGNTWSCGSFPGFHFFTIVAQLRWKEAWFIPYLGPSYQTVPFIVIPVQCAHGTLAGLTQIVSHELVETATDPIPPLGWIDNGKFSLSDLSAIFSQGEASDLCESSATPYASIGGVATSTYWSNYEAACIPAPPQCPTSASPSALALRAAGLAPAARTTSPPAGARSTRPLFARPLAALHTAHDIKVTATMSAAAAPQAPAVRASYTLWQQGTRASIRGHTDISSHVESFAIIQVGHRRCYLGSHTWRCQNGMPRMDVTSLVTQLFAQRTFTPVSVFAKHQTIGVHAEQGGVTYRGLLTLTATGRPARLTMLSRVGKRIVGSQAVSIYYGTPGEPQIRLPR